jgi:hypothetical protein
MKPMLKCLHNLLSVGRQNTPALRREARARTVRVLSDADAITFAVEHAPLTCKLVRYDGPSRRAAFEVGASGTQFFIVAEGVEAWRYAHLWSNTRLRLKTAAPPTDDGRGPAHYALELLANDGTLSRFLCGGIRLYKSEDLRNELELSPRHSETYENNADERTNLVHMAQGFQELTADHPVKSIAVVSYAGGCNSYDELLLKVEMAQDPEPLTDARGAPPPSGRPRWIVCGGLHQMKLRAIMPSVTLACGKGDIPEASTIHPLIPLTAAARLLVLNQGENEPCFIVCDRLFIHNGGGDCPQDPGLPLNRPKKASRLSAFGYLPLWVDGPPLNRL